MTVSENPVLAAIDLGVALASPEIGVYFGKDGERFDFYDNQGDWSAYARQQALAALDAWAAVCNISVSETDDPDGATFRLTKADSPHGSLGFMNPPDPEYGDTQGIAWFNSLPYWSGRAGGMLDAGAYMFTIFLHEFGHGLGLAHPHDESGESGLMPEVGGGLGLDQGLYTVMTYNDGWPEAPEGLPESRAWGWNLGPSALDIAVAQAKYGANLATGAGRDRYVLPTKDQTGTGWLCIWDAGGRDAIVHRGGADATIDLRPATLLAEEGGGGRPSWVDGIHGGFTLANGVVIEQAIGGRGDDRLVASDAGARLRGREGADRIEGGAGADRLQGDQGADRLSGGDGDDVLAGGAGRDRLRGGAGDDLFRLAPGDGADRILDFEAGDGIDLAAFGLSPRQAAAALSARDEDVVLSLDHARLLVLDATVEEVRDALILA